MKFIEIYLKVRDVLRKTSLIPWILLIAMVVVFYMNFKRTAESVGTITEQKNAIEALTDTVKVVINKDSSKTATINVFQSQREEDFITIKNQQDEIVALQELVKDYKSRMGEGASATKFSTETVINKVIELTGDSLKLPEGYKDPWLKLKGRINDTFLNLTLNLKNEYDVVIGNDKYGFLNTKRKPFAEVTSYNPYANVTTLRSYSVKVPPPKRFGVGVHVGYGLSLNPTPTISPVISIGVNYNLIEF